MRGGAPSCPQGQSASGIIMFFTGEELKELPHE